MAHEVILPKQGQSVETCLILGWKKKVGERCRKAKPWWRWRRTRPPSRFRPRRAAPCWRSTTEQGEDVPVLAPLALIGQPGEAVAAATGSASPRRARAARCTLRRPRCERPRPLRRAPRATGARPRVAGATPRRAGGRPAISPRARRLAERSGLSSAEAAAALPQGGAAAPEAGSWSGTCCRPCRPGAGAATPAGRPLRPHAAAAGRRACAPGHADAGRRAARRRVPRSCHRSPGEGRAQGHRRAHAGLAGRQRPVHDARLGQCRDPDRLPPAPEGQRREPGAARDHHRRHGQLRGGADPGGAPGGQRPFRRAGASCSSSACTWPSRWTPRGGCWCR